MKRTLPTQDRAGQIRAAQTAKAEAITANATDAWMQEQYRTQRRAAR
jgi:hypothetical protein